MSNASNPVTPASLSMVVIAKTRDATYVRLAPELQLPMGKCHCPSCNGSEGKWDTLAIPRRRLDHTWHVHMPDGAAFQARVDAEEKAKKAK